MAAFSTEVFIFETSEAFRSNPEKLVHPVLKIALNTGRVQAPAFYGTQIENPNTGYAFLNWDSYESHQALANSSSHAALREALGPCLGGKTEMHHVIFSAPTIALEKSVTEVLILSLKAPENRDAVVEILSKISEASNKMLVFGQTREDENKYILIGGWPSVEAHEEMAAKPEVKAAVDKVYSLANKDHHYHTKLSQYTL